MATLPETEQSIYELSPISEPSLTWNIDKASNQIAGEVDGVSAVKQAVDIIMNVERYRWQIYQSYSGMEYDGLIGNDPGYVAAEFQRRVRDAFSVDDRITGVSDYESSQKGNIMEISFTVNTVYGNIPVTTEVTLQ